VGVGVGVRETKLKVQSKQRTTARHAGFYVTLDIVSHHFCITTYFSPEFIGWTNCIETTLAISHLWLPS
jgi:hypothetical protein